MRRDKMRAVVLRKQGKSYTEIRNALRVPKSTLSNWLGHTAWSRKIRENLSANAVASNTLRIRELDRIRGEHLARVYAEAREEARKEFKKLRYDPLFIAGIMLYWGEGDKVTRHTVRLANADPRMIRLFTLFLLHSCKIPKEKVRAYAVIYPDLNAHTCIRYWSQQSGLELDSFTKCSVITGRHKTNRLSYGTCTICVSNTYFKVKMLEWLALLSKELMSGR